MDNARIHIYEDSEDMRQLLEWALEDDHTIAGTATTMPEARALIDTVEPGQIDVAIVDGNLGELRGGKDGQEIIGRLREKLGHVVIVSFSAGDAIHGADFNSNKDTYEVVRIINDEL